MTHSVETSEHRPWDVQSVLDGLDHIRPLAAKDICRELRAERPMLAEALYDALMRQIDVKRKLTAAALLLMLNDSAGREPFLAALMGPDGEIRNLAIDYLESDLSPCDLELGWRLGRTHCPLRSDEVFDALRRDLHEPWTDLRVKILRILHWQDYPQVRSLTHKLLSHSNAALRREIAESYLRAGRDEGAFAVLEEILRNAPDHMPHGDPKWHEFYETKGIWNSIKEAAAWGEDELRMKVARLAMDLVGKALDARNAPQRFDVNDGLISAHHAAKAMAAVMPNGARELLERMIESGALSEYDRGETLLAYARALGDQARPVILEVLGDPAMRTVAANALGSLTKDKNDPEDIAALSDALAAEDRPHVVAALAKALLSAGPAGNAAVEAAIERSEPWTKVELAWRIGGGTDREFADQLTESGVMDAITDEELSEALSNNFDVRSLIWAGGERLAMFNVKASGDMEHYALFNDLLQISRPTVTVENLREDQKSTSAREPLSEAPSIEKVTDLGARCDIRFSYQGLDYAFEAYPQGRWHDVPAVMKGFDDFMRSIGREDRCYELEGDGEWALFVVAPASKFEPIAARLGIPIERDSESARDAAKAYQRQIQDMSG
jgi:hypothetical protein